MEGAKNKTKQNKKHRARSGDDAACCVLWSTTTTTANMLQLQALGCGARAYKQGTANW